MCFKNDLFYMFNDNVNNASKYLLDNKKFLLDEDKQEVLTKEFINLLSNNLLNNTAYSKNLLLVKKELNEFINYLLDNNHNLLCENIFYYSTEYKIINLDSKFNLLKNKLNYKDENNDAFIYFISLNLDLVFKSRFYALGELLYNE